MCRKDMESMNHFLHQYPFFDKERQVLASKIVDIDSWSIDQNETSFFYALHFVKENMDGSKNVHIFKATIEYILSTEKFSFPLFE